MYFFLPFAVFMLGKIGNQNRLKKTKIGLAGKNEKRRQNCHIRKSLNILTFNSSCLAVNKVLTNPIVGHEITEQEKRSRNLSNKLTKCHTI